MAEGSDTNGQGTGPPGNGSGTPAFGGFGAADTREKDNPNDGQQPKADTPATVKDTAAQQLQNEYHDTTTQPGQKSEKPSVAATDGAAQSGSAPGREVQTKSPASNVQEVKSSPTDSKPVAASPAAGATADKTQASAGKSQSESPKELIASNPYAKTNTDQSIQPQVQKSGEAKTVPAALPSGNDQTGTSAQALSRSDHNATDNQQAKTNTASSEKPPQQIGGEAREHSDSQAPPAPVAKAQENSYQPSKTSSDAKPEINKIPAVPIPIENQSQKNQNPAGAAQKPETAPGKPQQDLVAKSQEAKNLPADTQKQNTNDGKPGPEAEQHKKLDESPKSPAAGELGSNNSAGKGGKLVPEPNTTTDANVRGGTGKEFDVAHENTTREALNDRSQPQSQIRHGEQTAVNTSRLDGIDAIIEKSRENQQDSPVVPIGKRDGKEPIVSQPDVARDPKVDNSSGKDKDTDIANKTETRQSGNEVSSGSMGAGFDGRPGRVNDKTDQKVEAIERGEIFKTLDGKSVKLDLSDKATCKQLLDLINQIETNKFKPLDQTGRERLNLLSEMQPTSQKQLKELLTAFVTKDVPVDSRAGLLLQDKLEPSVAERFKQQVNKILELEHSNLGIKQIVSRVSEALDHFLLKVFSAPKQELEKEVTDANGLVLTLADSADPMQPEVREFVINMKEILPRDIGDLDVVPEEAPESIDDTPFTTNSTKVDRSGHSREQYLVQDKDTPKSIALKCSNNEALWRLILEINKPEATYSDVNDKIRNRDFLAGELIHLPTYTERQKFLKPKGVPHESS